MIHQFKLEDVNVVMDVYSGAIHIVDDVVYELVSAYESKTTGELKQTFEQKYDENVLNEAIKEIEILKEQEMLFTEDIYEKSFLPDFKNRKPVIKALCLHIAHDCNLGCKYCFAGEGEYHGDRSLMSFDIGKKAIDFILQNSGNRKNLEVDFFGGEPLMNFEVVKQIVEYARSVEKDYNKNFRFTITTNGVLLNDEIEQYINENMYNVVLSIDGRKEVNDLMRPARNGKGSYDLILPKYKKIAESRNQENYYVRGTFTRNNLDFAKDVIHLVDEGFKQISMEPVVSAEEAPYSLKEEHLPILFEQYEELARHLIQKKNENDEYNFFHFMIDLKQGPCVSKRL